MAQTPAPKSVFRIKLNLLYPQGAPTKLPVKFLKWLLSYGRLIVILVEIVVLVTFGLRFKYDADLANLKENIKKEQQFLQQLSNNENDIRMLQNRLELIKQVYGVSPQWRETIIKVANQMPQSISLTSLNIEKIPPANELHFKLNGKTTSVNDLGGFVNVLTTEAGFKDVSLVSIALDDGELLFAVTGTVQ